MRHQGHRDINRRGEGMHPREKHHGHMGAGAKTFRRGRAIAFLEVLNTKKATLQQQLAEPELQSINPVIAGELKAIEMVISEFIQVFELHESELQQSEKQVEDKMNDVDVTPEA